MIDGPSGCGGIVAAKETRVASIDSALLVVLVTLLYVRSPNTTKRRPNHINILRGVLLLMQLKRIKRPNSVKCLKYIGGHKPGVIRGVAPESWIVEGISFKGYCVLDESVKHYYLGKIHSASLQPA